MLRILPILAALAGVTACSSPVQKHDAGAEDGRDVGVEADAPAADGSASEDARTPDASSDVATVPDLPPEPAYCESASGAGFFPDCEACDANGLDCDSIDAPGASGRACGCAGSGCPCGLRCGSYEIAPNVTVSDICVR